MKCTIFSKKLLSVTSNVPHNAHVTIVCWGLTLVQLNCLFFIHLKLELLTHFPASNDEKNIYHVIYEKRDTVISNIELLDYTDHLPKRFNQM